MVSTRHGYPLDAWQAAKAEAKAVLRERARVRGTITYGELCDCGVMLASLVVGKATGSPGEGYFSFAGRLGRDTSDREAFWRGEVERIYAAYDGEGIRT